MYLHIAKYYALVNLCNVNVNSKIEWVEMMELTVIVDNANINSLGTA